jgi:hypothetical protein
VDHRKEEPGNLGRPRIGCDVLPGFLPSDGKKEESGDQEVTNPLKGPETQETRGRLGCIGRNRTEEAFSQHFELVPHVKAIFDSLQKAGGQILALKGMSQMLFHPFKTSLENGDDFV